MHFIGTYVERIKCAGHGDFGEFAGMREAFAEANDAGKGVDDMEAAARRAGHQQPAIVGAKIKRRIDWVQRVCHRRGWALADQFRS